MYLLLFTFWMCSILLLTGCTLALAEYPSCSSLDIPVFRPKSLKKGLASFSKAARNNCWLAGVIVGVLFITNIVLQKRDRMYRFSLDYSGIADKEAVVAERIEPVPAGAVTAQMPLPEKEVTLDGLGLELQGTVVGNPSVAFIKDTATGQSRMYKINSVIKGARLISIAGGKIVLQREGIQKVFALKGRTVEQDSRVVVYEDKVKIQRTYVKKQMHTVNKLLSKMKISPVKDKEGHLLAGYKIDQIPLGSIIEKAGIKNGDVVRAVEGMKLKSTKAALKVFSSIRNKSQVEVELLRSGRPVRITYELTE